ncbi:MAG: OsmC family peroxiredoxin [Chthoniobacterales bacterium]
MNPIIRKSSVHWKGGARGGTRTVTTESGVIKEAFFSSQKLLKKSAHTDPAELVAAALATSFSLALSNELKLRPVAAGMIATTASVTQDHSIAGWTIKKVHLNVIAKLPDVTQGTFIDATIRAKTHCLISKLLRANISMNAKLEK